MLVVIIIVVEVKVSFDMFLVYIVIRNLFYRFYFRCNRVKFYKVKKIIIIILFN